VTLAVAQRLAALLREGLGAETILTRRGDETLELGDRTERANAEAADLFVSIHANASPNRQAAGIETYYLNNTNDRASIRLAAMENGLDYVPQAEGTRLRYILSDLLQVGKIEESVRLARTVQRTLVGHLGSRYSEVADLGVKQGPFYVLVGAHMPCVLVEVSFLTHPVEGRRLASDAYQAAVAEGLYGGIAAYLADARRERTL
jgi:N-acetylmuramoyl-L-alanine amidase